MDRKKLIAIANMAIKHKIPIFPCYSKKKTPLIKDWPNKASCKSSDIKKWIKEFLVDRQVLTYWGMPLGKYFIVDKDEPGWGEIKKEWLKDNPYTQRTSKKGKRHWFFENSQGFVGRHIKKDYTKHLQGGCDIIGNKSFCILYDKIFSKTRPPSKIPAPPVGLIELIAEIRNIKGGEPSWDKGSRNETFNKEVFKAVNNGDYEKIPKILEKAEKSGLGKNCLLYTSPSPRD